jgi:hypothetical protein
MRPILDCRETVIELCRLPRTVGESVAERWRNGAGSFAILGIRSLRCLHTCWRGRSMRPIFDCRETVMELCRPPRTVGESVAERWRDGAGSLPTLGYSVTKMLAHMLARAVDAADFRLSRNGDGAEATAVHSLRACGGAMTRRRRLNACGIRSHRLCWCGVDVTRFSTVEKRRWGRLTVISKP